MFRGGNKVSAGGLGKLNNATKAKSGSRNNIALSSSQNNAGDRVLSKAQAEAASTLRNDTRNLLLIFPTLEEFAPEREVLSHSVIPELQQFCCDRAYDLECWTFFENDADPSQLLLLQELLRLPETTAICFVGDKYGEVLLPLELTVEEFNAIQGAALELSKDVNLLQQYYSLDRSREPNEYRLTLAPFRDPEAPQRLREVVTRGVKSAMDDGQIHQVNQERHASFFRSFIAFAVEEMLHDPSRHLFVTRMFKGYEAKDHNDRWTDASKEKFDKVSELKNEITRKAPQTNTFPFVLNLEGTDPTSWAKSKDSLRYESQLTIKLNDQLKTLLNLPKIPAHPMSYSASSMEIALREHATHERYLADALPRTWLAREAVDAKLSHIVDQGMTKSLCVLLHGSGTGKTAALCRLHQLLKEKDCYVVTRFAYLTDSSLFANELFRNIFLKVCDISGRSPSALLGAFHLSNVLSHLKTLMEQLDRPLFVLIDDAHLLKYGRTLSGVEKPLRKMLPKLTIVFTSANPTTISCFPAPEPFEMPALQLDQTVEIVKNQCSDEGRKLSSDQTSALRKKLKKSSGNVILAEVQCQELLAGQPEPSGSMEERLRQVETELGVENTRIICQLLCCLPYGITMLEAADGYRLMKRTSGMSFEPRDVLAIAPLEVIKKLGKLLHEVHTDNRRVWVFRHQSVAQAVRQRYLPSAGDIKLANEVLVELMSSVPSSEDENDPVTSNLVFPQPINKDNGAVNWRRVRYHWYYLLHAANIDGLKKSALCCFEYLDAAFRGCGLAHLLSIFEEALQQILDHDLLVLFEQTLLPAIQTLTRDQEQLVSEIINRLRYTRSQNSEQLNGLVEQAMLWTDVYSKGPLLVPLTCWINPPKMKQVISFTIPQWKSSKTIIQPTLNHQHLITAGNELSVGTVYMYHIASHILVRTFNGHTDRVTSLCTSRDGLFFCSTSYDGTARLWNFYQDECIKVLKVSNARVLCSLMSSDDKWIVTGSSDSTARVINVETGVVRRAFRDHTGPVVGVQLSSDNELLVTGSGDFVVMVWDINAGAIAVKMGGLMAPVTCLAITSNDTFLAVSCEDETLRIFSTVSAQELHEISGHDSRVNAMAASADDCQLFAATKGKVYCYDVHNGKLLETLECALPQAVTSLKISDDNSFVLAACGDRVHMWNMNSIEREPPHNDRSSLTCIKIAPDEKGAGCGTEDGILAFWDLDVCQCLWTTAQQKTGAVSALDFTPDSMYILSGSSHGHISVWETSNGQLLKTFQVHREEVRAICCFSDGYRVLSCDASDTSQIWSLSYVEDPNQLEQLATVTGVRAPLYLRSNDTILVGQHSTNPKELYIWSMSGDNRLAVKTKAHHNEEIICYSVNKSGTMLVTGSADQSLKCWIIDTGFLTQVLVGHEDVVTCCGVSEDGKSVVSGGRDKAIIVWEVQTGTVRRSISAKAPVVAVEITFDGSVIVSADEGGWIEARSADNYRLLSSFNTHRSISQISISMDANRILAKLTNTAQLPILCLHNTPANVSMSNVHRRQHRIHSTTSFTSNAGGDEAWLSQQNAAGAKRGSVASASGSGRRGSRIDAAVAGGSSQPPLANASPPSNTDISSGNPSTATAMTVGEDKSSNANSTTGSNAKANAASRSQKKSSMCCTL